MKIYDLQNDNGEAYAFEVPNWRLPRWRVARIVRRVPGARVIRSAGIFGWFGPEEFCEFVVGDVTFVVWEPFGDNSRYWIGPRPVRPVLELRSVRAAFAAA